MGAKVAIFAGINLLSLFLMASNACGEDSEYTNTYTVTMDKEFESEVSSWLEHHDFKYLNKISDIQIYNNTKPPPIYTIDQMLQKWRGKIISMRRVRKQYITYGQDRIDQTASMPVCSPQYDTSHAVENAHALGFTGKGVVVAVTDEGFAVTHIMANINLELSKNFDSETADLRPGDDSGNPEIQSITNHGNVYSSMIAGDDDPLFCSRGIAQGAVMTLLKIGSINLQERTIATDSTKYSQALQYHRDRIDVYANSWGTDEALSSCEDIVQDVLKVGIEQGRGGKGSIFVFPSGPVGNCLPNSIYTIAVNGLLANNTVIASSRRSSAVLVSAFVGENSGMDHTGYPQKHRRCVAELESTSSATAKVAGIVGLILHANRKLSWRDVQHILVNSVQNPYPCMRGFKKNAAGHFFGDVMGFGIVNATRAVLLAQKWANVPAQVSSRNQFESIGSSFSIANVTCANGCVTTVEHVVVTFEFTRSSVEPFKFTLESPRGTVSTLIECDELLNYTVKEPQAELTSVHFWGEPSDGMWILTVFKNCDTKKATSLQSDIVSRAVLVVYGTEHPQKSTTDAFEVPYLTSVLPYSSGPLDVVVILLSCGVFLVIFPFIIYKTNETTTLMVLCHVRRRMDVWKNR